MDQIEPRLYIVMREDLYDNNPGKMMAQAAHAQADFDDYYKESKSDDLLDAVAVWKEDRAFGTTITLSTTFENFALIEYNVSHAGTVVDPTYPYRNHYGKMFTRAEVTCMWVFVTDQEDLEYMKQFDLHC